MIATSTFKTLYFFLLLVLMAFAPCSQQEHERSIERNGMRVSWHFEGDSVVINMTAPTRGWLCVGFNDTPAIQGAYLLMGRVKDGEVEVHEHYTQAPGKYRTIRSLGAPVSVGNITGHEGAERTRIKFSIPQQARSEFQRTLRLGMQQYMILAYSQVDDFQHHSIMREHVHITL